jgi:ribosomal protein L37AE/L43A
MGVTHSYTQTRRRSELWGHPRYVKAQEVSEPMVYRVETNVYSCQEVSEPTVYRVGTNVYSCQEVSEPMSVAYKSRSNVSGH